MLSRREQEHNKWLLKQEHPEYLSEGPRPEPVVDPRPHIERIKAEMAARKLSREQFGENNV
jgi:hypothetical protein